MLRGQAAAFNMYISVLQSILLWRTACTALLWGPAASTREGAYRVDDLLEEDRDFGCVQVAVVAGVVDELRHLVEPQLHGKQPIAIR